MSSASQAAAGTVAATTSRTVADTAMSTRASHRPTAALMAPGCLCRMLTDDTPPGVRPRVSEPIAAGAGPAGPGGPTSFTNAVEGL
ncbi:MAG: hypothetical protein IPO93_13055 [Actinobacteria bacterium]|nr:hypothetical protein [Actinomycetota bacterium]